MIDVSIFTDEALEGYDQMMIEVSLKVDRFSALALSIWDETLRELDLRGQVELISGSYEDVGNARIRRLYKGSR
jgi:hypothetical protein